MHPPTKIHKRYKISSDLGDSLQNWLADLHNPDVWLLTRCPHANHQAHPSSGHSMMIRPLVKNKKSNLRTARRSLFKVASIVMQTDLPERVSRVSLPGTYPNSKCNRCDLHCDVRSLTMPRCLICCMRSITPLWSTPIQHNRWRRS